MVRPTKGEAMRTPIIVKRGSIELLTNHELTLKPREQNPDEPHIPELPFVYLLKGWRGMGCVDVFQVATNQLDVRDDTKLGERDLQVWFQGEPSGAPPFRVRMSTRGEHKGVTITTDKALEGPRRAEGRQYVYTYEVTTDAYSYDLHTSGRIIEGRNLKDVAFVLALKHNLEIDLGDPFTRYVLLGAGAGLLGALLARELGSRRHRE
jgi:hypothetical protein